MKIKIVKEELIRLIYSLLRDPSSIKYIRVYIPSLLPRHTSLTDKVPWITFKARLWLESYLKPYMSVFEYGSGGSTIFISKRINKLISVEHDKDFHSKVSEVLFKEGVFNCEYILCEPKKRMLREKLPHCCQNYTTSVSQFARMSFKNYVQSIEKYPDGSFDLVIVDGRARVSCVYHALSKIRPGGYLMLDDSNRQRYDKAKRLLAGYKRKDFFGISPYSTSLSQTSVWEIKSAK